MANRHHVAAARSPTVAGTAKAAAKSGRELQRLVGLPFVAANGLGPATTSVWGLLYFLPFFLDDFNFISSSICFFSINKSSIDCSCSRAVVINEFSISSRPATSTTFL